MGIKLDFVYDDFTFSVVHLGAGKSGVELLSPCASRETVAACEYRGHIVRRECSAQ